ncbi:hypothetical protein [Spirosoma sp. 209]|uniref:hypothetical protein n=1 Tax=Spirosoma sp. 209 TaxID=1955701 RepID=UPI00098D15DF|nr:hypothetical protein [Spirosoma sp. 209]
MEALKLEKSVPMLATQLSELTDIHDVEPLNDSDYDCLTEIRDVLKKHGRQERFGVMLLHKHFDIASDEVLVEYTDIAGRMQTIKPEKKGSTLLNTIETSWILGDGDRIAMTICNTRCWKDVHGNHNSQHV